MRAVERKKKKKVMSRVHSIYIFLLFFFSLNSFFFIRSCVIFHVVFQSSRLVTILLPDGHCVLLRWVMVEYVCLPVFSIFSTFTSRLSYNRIIDESF